MKLIISCLLFLGIALGASAQSNPKYICDTNAFGTVDLGLDVIGQVLTRADGQWDQVNPDNNSEVLASDVDNIVVLAGKPAGVYEFIYTAINNECMEAGTTVKATVVILETAKDLYHVVYSCPNETPTLDLMKVVSPGLENPSFIATSAGEIIDNTLAMGNYEGTIEVLYNAGNTNGCNDNATITIEVKRDGSEPELTNSVVTYCQSSVPDAVNLANLSGISADSGTWTVKSGDASVVDGEATFNTLSGSYVFTYVWESSTCYAEGNVDLTIIISASGLTLPSSSADAICKTENPNRIYNLALDGLGLALPISAGKWVEVAKPTSQAIEIDVADGLFEVASARAGDYTYKYVVYEVADVCGLTGNTTFTLTVGDVSSNGYDGRVQLCALDLETASGNFKLSDYVMDMPTAATWNGITGADIVNGDEVAYSELYVLGVGTYKFTYDYISTGCTKTGTGTLYITITNKLDISSNISLSFCRPDMPSSINLKQVIGADIVGIWDGSTSTDTSFTLNNGIFTETASIGGGAKTYTIVFTPEGSSSCDLPNTITVNITVNDDSF